jgi:L-threonylcarbamoyladenylate synthase
MRVLRISADVPEPEAIGDAARVLERGGLVAYPTDTLYGLAVDPRSDAAVLRLFAAKGRDSRVAVPLIASDLTQAQMIGGFGESELRLAHAFWPGPLTIVVPRVGSLSAHLTGGSPTIAMRVPAHPVARALAAALRCPVTATSANVSGQEPAASIEQIAPSLHPHIEVLLDAGPATGGPPSTIVEIAADGPRLIRAGAIAWELVIQKLEARS